VSWGRADVGVIFGNGLGVGQDLAKALTYFRQACQGGFVPACDTVKKLSTP
jgi:TPR repeat protein